MNFKALTSKAVALVYMLIFVFATLVLFTSSAMAHPKKIKSVAVYEVTICIGTDKIKSIKLVGGWSEVVEDHDAPHEIDEGHSVEIELVTRYNYNWVDCDCDDDDSDSGGCDSGGCDSGGCDSGGCDSGGCDSGGCDSG